MAFVFHVWVNVIQSLIKIGSVIQPGRSISDPQDENLAVNYRLIKSINEKFK